MNLFPVPSCRRGFKKHFVDFRGFRGNSIYMTDGLLLSIMQDSWTELSAISIQLSV
jgi:hypothetical protein